jgi:hypothetical protein
LGNGLSQKKSPSRRPAKVGNDAKNPRNPCESRGIELKPEQQTDSRFDGGIQKITRGKMRKLKLFMTFICTQ